MQQAIEEAYEGINNKHGGPFGCVIVKDGKVIGKGHNRVLKNLDPTAHGEVEAIRDACKNLKTFNLDGCELYTTAEPCPMCLGAILWSNIKTVYYGCNKKDTNDINFRDDKFYNYFETKDPNILVIKENNREKCLKLFKGFMSKEHTIY